MAARRKLAGRSRWTETTRSVGLAGTAIHLRHAAASLLIAAGAGAKAVQMILRKATATMTLDVYGHLSSETPWVAMERMPMFPEPEAGSPSVGGSPPGEHGPIR